jgi:hypothetical protein
MASFFMVTSLGAGENSSRLNDGTRALRGLAPKTQSPRGYGYICNYKNTTVKMLRMALEHAAAYKPLPEGGFRKDIDRIAAFVKAAKAA